MIRKFSFSYLSQPIDVECLVYFVILLLMSGWKTVSHLMSIVLFCQMKGVVYFLFERWYKQYRNIEFISVEIMYGGESVQNISKDDVQSIEIGIKILFLSSAMVLQSITIIYVIILEWTDRKIEVMC